MSAKTLSELRAHLTRTQAKLDALARLGVETSDLHESLEVASLLAFGARSRDAIRDRTQRQGAIIKKLVTKGLIVCDEFACRLTWRPK